MTPVEIYAIAIVSIVALAIFVWWYWPSQNLAEQVETIAMQVGGALQGLQDFETACADRPQVESLYVELASIVNDHEYQLDRSSELIEQVSSLIKQTYFAADFSSTSNQLKELHTELVAARAKAMHEVHHALTEMLPDLREKLSQLPIQSSSIAVGVLTLVGVVWMSGYYSLLGVPFIPFLRDFQDVALVGFGAGLLPLMAFTVMATFTLIHVERTRQVARRPTARAAAIATALKVARNLRRPSFWAHHAILCMVTVFTASLAAAAASQERSQFEMALADKPDVTRMRILGGIGDYLVLSEGNDSRVVTVPKERLKCFETVGSAENQSQPEEFCTAPESPTAPDHSAVVSFTQPEDWRAYVQREAQCWVVAPSTPKPLLSPVFVARSSRVLNKNYYDERPAHWPFPREKCEGETLEQCANKGIRDGLQAWLSSIDKSRPSGATLHLFGFASGTAKPKENVDLSRERAKFVANNLVGLADELKLGCEDLPEKANGVCPIRFEIHAMGEMPRFTWAGTQGDPTEQIVLIAACNNDTL